MNKLATQAHEFGVRFASLVKAHKKDWQICGVSLLPVQNVRGKWHAVLGKENSGRYRNKLNFIGGKVGDKVVENASVEYNIARALFEEVYEELHLVLESDALQSCLLGVLTLPLPRRQMASMLFVANIEGIDVERWDAEHERRMNAKYPACFCEMTSIQKISLDDCFDHDFVDERKPPEQVSHYVATAMPEVKKLIKNSRPPRPVQASAFYNSSSSLSP